MRSIVSILHQIDYFSKKVGHNENNILRSR